MTYTYKQYMNDECTHNDYYGQYVTPEMIKYVSRMIGREKILESKDKHFNDIQLGVWDSINVMQFINRELWINNYLSSLDPKAHPNNAEAHATRRFYYSLSDNVCVAKAAARKIRMEEALT